MNLIAILLPFIAWMLIFYSVRRWEECWRSTVLTTSVILGVIVVGITEGLSVIPLLTVQSICLAWLIITIGLAWWAWKIHKYQSSGTQSSGTQVDSFTPAQTIFGVGIIGILLIVGVISIIAPPNNWDSMAYVMARVVHWIQNQTVAHYPTHYPPQLYNGPWAEFVILHFQLLSHSDRFANLLHWLSFVGSIIGISLVTKRLKGDLNAQIFSAVFCATIPVGILHASTPKNTYVVTFWLVSFLYYALLILTTRLTWRLTWLISASLGLAVLTKGSGYVYIFPFALALFGFKLYELRFNSFKYLIVSISIIWAVNLGHYFRNFHVFGSPTSTYPYKWTNDIYSPSVFISNIIRNISLHLTIPFLYGSQFIDKAVLYIHQFLHISPVDPRTTLDVVSMTHPEDFTVNGSPLFEDLAGNPLHFWLILIVMISLSCDRRLRREFMLVAYLLLSLSAFFLFCFLIKWQPWHSRLHLPIFVFFAPVVGIVLSQVWHPKIAKYTLLLFLLATTPYLLFNDLRSIVGEPNIFTNDRVTQYFAARSDLLPDYRQVTQLVKDNACPTVGLVIAPGSWEYPLWVLLTENNPYSFRLEHVLVQNKTNSLAETPAFKNFVPCSIIAVGALPEENLIRIHDHDYQMQWDATTSRERVRFFDQQPADQTTLAIDR